MTEKVKFNISSNTKYIISTSGRISSLKRYQILLQEILQLDICYLPIHNGNDNDPTITPQRFVNALKGMPCIGGAISKDIKHSIIPYLDEIDDIANKIQSVNTVIVLPDGKLKGYNTDALGFRDAINNGINKSSIQVKNAVCYGYGGVASVVVSVLHNMNINVYLIGRNKDTALKRSTELGIEVWDGQKVDLFINATPASESPLDLAPYFKDALSNCSIAFDHEMPGKYLSEYCNNNNIYHIDGYQMYYPQMYKQWELFLNNIISIDRIPALITEAENKLKEL